MNNIRTASAIRRGQAPPAPASARSLNGCVSESSRGTPQWQAANRRVVAKVVGDIPAWWIAAAAGVIKGGPLRHVAGHVDHVAGGDDAFDAAADTVGIESDFQTPERSGRLLASAARAPQVRHPAGVRGTPALAGSTTAPRPGRRGRERHGQRREGPARGGSSPVAPYWPWLDAANSFWPVLVSVRFARWRWWRRCGRESLHRHDVADGHRVAGPPGPDQAVGAADLHAPRGRLTSVGSGVDIEPDVRILPLEAGDRAGHGDGLAGVEFGGEVMVRCRPRWPRASRRRRAMRVVRASNPREAGDRSLIPRPPREGQPTVGVVGATG